MLGQRFVSCCVLTSCVSDELSSSCWQVQVDRERQITISGQRKRATPSGSPGNAQPAGVQDTVDYAEATGDSNTQTAKKVSTAHCGVVNSTLAYYHWSLLPVWLALAHVESFLSQWDVLKDPLHLQEEGQSGWKNLQRERRFGSFKRSWTLPENADVSAIRASVQHGVLTLTISKTKPSEPEVTSIPIN